jgi:hypothetical protein
LFKQLAPQHQPISDLQSTILELKDGLERARFNDDAYRDSQYIRLNVINNFRWAQLLTKNLEWSHAPTMTAAIH